MSHVSTRGLVQDATMWVAGRDGYGGDTYGPPIPIKVRWEDRSEQYVSQLDRQEMVSRAIVFIDRAVNVGDWLCFGEISALDPSVIDGASKIRRYEKIPDLRTLKVQRRVYL